jgi:hypothetical protein
MASYGSMLKRLKYTVTESFLKCCHEIQTPTLLHTIVHKVGTFVMISHVRYHKCCNKTCTLQPS